MGVKENVEAAALADLVFEEVVLRAGDPPTIRFWERLIELCRDKLPSKETPESMANRPMSDREAIAFERLELEWGKYKGVEIGCVDAEYLVFLVEGDKMKEKLKRYVRSDRFRARQKESS